MKGAWNSRDKCAERGLEVKWGTHWCPAVDMECEVPGCLRHDRKTGALKTFTSGAWAVGRAPLLFLPFPLANALTRTVNGTGACVTR